MSSRHLSSDYQAESIKESLISNNTLCLISLFVRAQSTGVGHHFTEYTHGHDVYHAPSVFTGHFHQVVYIMTREGIVVDISWR